jgi:hypothetical protein
LVCKDIELVTVDAAQYDIPDDVTVAYFYNPFEGQVFSDVVDRIRASLVRRPRNLRLIYVNPVMHDYLIHSGFRMVREVRHSALYTMTTWCGDHQDQAAAGGIPEAHLVCHCWQVIRDDEPEQETCPHGRPWAGIIQLVHDERPDPA